ncbi:catechol 2,3-dioxygenase-like lactoylglutathione lyase family enzyme [Pseudomonas citronellolis]|uniref:VOC family protein n=1 Tax=Pseudomonas citronellolis TaxID=53408 RepID=UPI00209EBEB9|nr:VOC family protein [Pseudomonas citronellolis]MCP1646138.1 catechol 2,3-dioxygenase-like lactoylglutathione lyase family enzyme [Pseudomonas citronellolis]MCP1669171.1 catechol 2,3-dioxygenase-like lactoylglutathione lyase family enzyme [Pseudomonas citronellolis]MCP1700617.1 catechol 2,3-dioxygenase-like lactoylglutathione lyase family enzyme [Pseudomonas citronellolis]MCP1706930.1 catechol 2,3-dioxygenase-like lactoylglutathione lyase family enzyme [Pseudomonas citronellolis]MCP1800764.1 
MSVLGIDEITYGVEDLPRCRRFFEDWGLSLVEERADQVVFETLNGCRVVVAALDRPGLPPAIEPGSTVREVVWGVASADDLALYASRIATAPGFVEGGGRIGCTDPNGLAIRLQVTRKRELVLEECGAHNTWNSKARINKPSPVYERATPVEVGHVVFFVKDVDACEAFYREAFGFQTSDRYPGRGAFLRTAEEGGHHDLFMLQLPAPRAGLNHVAFTVRDINEVFGGGMHIARCGWDTEIGPGRHPVSSAFFWYFKNPAGALVEYYADEDQLTGDWQPRSFEPGPTVFAEWAIAGGLDGVTRRQKGAEGPQGKFLTEKNKS